MAYRRASKRKLEADDHCESISVRMKLSVIGAEHPLSALKYVLSPSISPPDKDSRVSQAYPDFKGSSFNSTSSILSSSLTPSDWWRRADTPVQFFVKMIPNTRTEVNISNLVMHAYLTDSVHCVHEKIEAVTGIPVHEQRLIYRGKQLQWETTLAECSIQNDASLQLVGRLRSTDFPYVWQAIDAMTASLRELCVRDLRDQVYKFLEDIPDNLVCAANHLQIFLTSSIPSALVMLFLSPDMHNKMLAEEVITHLVEPYDVFQYKNLRFLLGPIVLEFCKLLNKHDYKDNLYHVCRSRLGELVETLGIADMKTIEFGQPFFDSKDCFPFVCELASDLCLYLSPLGSSLHLTRSFKNYFSDFTAFVHPLVNVIMKQVKAHGPVSLPIQKCAYHYSSYSEEIGALHSIFIDLLRAANEFLQRMEKRLASKEPVVGLDFERGWALHLAILKELSCLAKLFVGAETLFWTVMRLRKVAVCELIVMHAKKSEDNHQWLMEHQDVTNFEARRHLALMMLPKGEDDYDDLFEMLIDRSELLEESFEYIRTASPESLHTGLFVEFKNEEATGPGVLREWFLLVCQALFNPQNALFIPCPNDRTRFYPNPASKTNGLHLEYYHFCGRVIALALMYELQVGIVFDRVFFLQLAGRRISLEDIQDADPSLYNSCKQILDMDAEFINSDGLGLTFVREVEELGHMEIVELCPGGGRESVNSGNRELYVNLLIQHQFCTSIATQVSHFSKGFADILSDSESFTTSKLFFRSLAPKDLDLMLRGSEVPICVEDWKLHTTYDGYKETDQQILWFWMIVGNMSAEQKKTLLFFWTSVKYLPFEGFSGLTSPLCIYKTEEPHDHLPSSHTCFLRLSFPAYPSMAMMERHLNIITQEHIGCSFGTW